MKHFSTIAVCAVFLLTGCKTTRTKNLEAENARLRGQIANSVADEYERLTCEANASIQQSELRYRYYEFALPAHQADGVNIDPHNRVIEIVE